MALRRQDDSRFQGQLRGIYGVAGLIRSAPCIHADPFICLRHSATPFAFTDPFWAKYGPAIADSLKLTDPKLTVNPHRAQLDALIKRGVHYAVCDMASHRYAGLIARKTDGDAEAIDKEMAANVVGNAHFVTAGIIAVSRAQERGYSIAHTG
ncbi:MAG: hypothetical protein ACRD2I_23655 [Vicinamibacterales bacterium]